MNSPKGRILELFFTSPWKEFSYRDIERNTKVSIGSISKYVKELIKEDLLKERKLANAKIVESNFDNQTFRDLKRAYNIKILYSSGFVDFLYKEMRPEAIILFGSFGKGEDTEKSDIDISVIHGRKVLPDLNKFEKKLEREINLVRIPDLKNTSEEFATTLANGIVLRGYLDGFSELYGQRKSKKNKS